MTRNIVNNEIDFNDLIQLKRFISQKLKTETEATSSKRVHSLLVWSWWLLLLHQ